MRLARELQEIVDDLTWLVGDNGELIKIKYRLEGIIDDLEEGE